MAKSHSLSRRLLIGAAVYSLIMLLVIALILAVLNGIKQKNKKIQNAKGNKTSSEKH